MDCDVTHHSTNGRGWDVRGGLGSACELPSSTEERRQAPLSEVGFLESARQSRRGGGGAVWRGGACGPPARGGGPPRAGGGKGGGGGGRGGGAPRGAPGAP